MWGEGGGQRRHPFDQSQQALPLLKLGQRWSRYSSRTPSPKRRQENRLQDTLEKLNQALNTSLRAPPTTALVATTAVNPSTSADASTPSNPLRNKPIVLRLCRFCQGKHLDSKCRAHPPRYQRGYRILSRSRSPLRRHRSDRRSRETSPNRPTQIAGLFRPQLEPLRPDIEREMSRCYLIGRPGKTSVRIASGHP